MNSKETIRLRNLSIGYRIKGNDVKVVAHDINASLQSGELTCLIGSNGIGKSTLLRTLSAFQPRLDGDIVINDKNIDEFSDKPVPSPSTQNRPSRCLLPSPTCRT